MGKKYWPFCKTKNDHEASGSRSDKKPWVGRYVRIEFARRLSEENRPVPWPDANLPGGGWYLNSRRLCKGLERHDEVPSDLVGRSPRRPAYALNSYNWISFGTWEFDACRRAGYVGDLDYFDREIAAEEEENDDEDADEDEDQYEDDYAAEARTDNYHDDGGPAWDPETQPPNISEEEAIAMALANNKLNELAMWDGLAIQLRESALAQGRLATPPPRRRVPTTACRRLPSRSCRSLPSSSTAGVPASMVNARVHRPRDRRRAVANS
jgi:hypothetical protein